MSHNNTQVRPSDSREPLVLWEGKGERITAVGFGDDEAEIVLMRSFDWDAGPARSFAIRPEQLVGVAQALQAEWVRRLFSGAAAAIADIGQALREGGR